MQKYLLGLGTLAVPDHADMDKDGNTDVFDLGLLKREVLSGQMQ